MSVCPVCGKRVKHGSANKRKVQGVWAHKHRPKYKKPRLVLFNGYLISPEARDQLLAGRTPTGRKPGVPEFQQMPKRRR
jgi:hypothetical protein